GTNEAASHGLVNFRIHPMLPLLPGTVISNAADIYFDFNDPVRTPDAVLTAAMSTAVVPVEEGRNLFVFPQPANDHVQVRLNGMMPNTPFRLLGTDGRLIRS